VPNQSRAEQWPAIGFRPVVAGDLPRLHRWLNDPEVVRWWEGDDVSWTGVRETPRILRSITSR
jgi:hypothetical protein